MSRHGQLKECANVALDIAFYVSRQATNTQTDRRLEYLFWRIWSSETLQDDASIESLDRLVSRIMSSSETMKPPVSFPASFLGPPISPSPLSSTLTSHTGPHIIGASVSFSGAPISSTGHSTRSLQVSTDQSLKEPPSSNLEEASQCSSRRAKISSSSSEET